MKEEDEIRKQRERAQKMAEFEKWKNPPKANFVISKRATTEDGDVSTDRPSRRHLTYSHSLVLPRVHCIAVRPSVCL